MTLDPRLSVLPIWLWQILALLAISLFFAAVGLVFLCAQNRQWRRLAPSLPLAVFCYILMEGFLSLETPPDRRGAVNAAVHGFLLELPLWILIPAMVCLSVILALSWRQMLRFEQRHITPSSVKDAVDLLPLGVCCYGPGGRIVLANVAMETICTALTGEGLRNGANLHRTMTEGQLLPSCRRLETDNGPILLLPDGSARLLSVQQLDWEGGSLTALLLADVTEVYKKTLVLEAQNEQLFNLNRRLAGYNREIVDLTIQTEILDARARLHDEIGTDLLAMKKLLRLGLDDTEMALLRQRLRRNISFLKDDSETAAPDELAVLLQTARRLGVHVTIEGETPRDPVVIHIITTGLHECLTNLLRHAHGDTLLLKLRRENGRILAEYSGNGDPPAGPVRETGGLRILRAAAEQAGGTMTVVTEPAFRVILDLPKEVHHALQSFDRRRPADVQTTV